jgi:hypothetical protein
LGDIAKKGSTMRNPQQPNTAHLRLLLRRLQKLRIFQVLRKVRMVRARYGKDAVHIATHYLAHLQVLRGGRVVRQAAFWPPTAWQRSS